MKKLIVLFCSVFLTLSLYSQREISFDVYGDISENSFYQEFTKEYKKYVVKYDSIRVKILKSNLSSQDKITNLALIDKVLKNPLDLIFDYDKSVDRTLSIFEYIDYEENSDDIYDLVYIDHYRNQIKSYFQIDTNYNFKIVNPEFTPSVPYFLDSILQKIILPKSSALIMGYLSITSLPLVEDVSYNYWIYEEDMTIFHYGHSKDYLLYKESDYLSKFDFTFYFINKNTNFKEQSFDFVFDKDEIRNLNKGEFEDRVASRVKLVKDNGHLILTQYDTILRGLFDTGGLYRGTAFSYRVSNRKLKKILKKYNLTLIDIINLNRYDYLILKKGES